MMYTPHFYKFAFIDITKEIKESDIDEFLITNEYKYDGDVYIYTKQPKDGYITYSNEIMTALLYENQRYQYISVKITLHKNAVFVYLNDKDKLHHFTTREDAIAFFNECVRFYLSPKSYHCTERNCEMLINEEMIKKAEQYFCIINEQTDDWYVSPEFLKFCHSKKDQHFCFIDADDTYRFKK